MGITNQILSNAEGRELLKQLDAKGKIPKGITAEYKKKVIDPILQPKENRKIRNATKCRYDDIDFDSKLEMAVYVSMKTRNIPFKLKNKITLIDGFEYGGKKYQPITWTPDFYLEEHKFIIDAKGFSNDIAPLKIKLCKRWLLVNDMQGWEVIICKAQKDIPALIEKIQKRL